MVVKNIINPIDWTEEITIDIDSTPTDEYVISIAEGIIDIYNKTIMNGEIKRQLVGVFKEEIKTSLFYGDFSVKDTDVDEYYLKKTGWGNTNDWTWTKNGFEFDTENKELWALRDEDPEPIKIINAYDLEVEIMNHNDY